MRKTMYLHSSISLDSFLEWGMFQTEVIEKIKIYILYSIMLFQKSCSLCVYVEKYGKNGNIVGAEKMSFACQITRAKIQTQSHNILHVSVFHGNNA